MTERSAFSIVIASYNYAPYLERALQSALGQDYPPGAMEVIAVDDGSTDASREILRRHAGHPRLKIRLQENAGQAAAFASGVALAAHDYVCLLDADDAFGAGKLRVLDERIAALGGQARRGADLFLCHDLEIYDEQRQAIHPQSWFQHASLAGRASMTLRQSTLAYPFSVPAGQLYSRALLAAILEGLPAADWRSGADNPLAHAALLRAGVVHYVADSLARYRIHGANRLIAFDAQGRLAGRPQAHPLLLQRRPKLLWFLERYLETLALAEGERPDRVAYLKRLEATLPVSAEFATAAPARLSFIVAGSGAGLAATLEAIARQTHPDCEVLVATDDGAARGGAQRAVLLALKRASGKFISLIACGDRPDRDFAERHLYMHHYLGATMVSACDYRLDAEGDPAQEGGYGRRKLWPRRRQVAPLRRVPQGPWWAFSPRSGNVMRRTAMLDLFADHGLERGLPQGVPLEWLLLHYAAALGGCTQFAECLTSLRFEDGGAGGMHARHPGDARFVPRLPQPQSAVFYLELLSARLERFQAHFGPHVGRFAQWALALDAPEGTALPDPRQALAAAALRPEVAAMLAAGGWQSAPAPRRQ